MANWTAIVLRDRVLEHLSQKAAGQAAAPEDATLVDELVVAAHDRLRTIGLAPFAINAIPAWAQVPFRDYVAGDAGSSFGLGESQKPGQFAAEKELRRQVAIRKPPLRIKINPY